MIETEKQAAALFRYAWKTWKEICEGVVLCKIKTNDEQCMDFAMGMT